MSGYEKHVEENPQKIYACDVCRETFYISEVILTSPQDRLVTIPLGNKYLYLDKKGDVVGGDKPPKSENGDKVLTCPKCKAQHLFGFQFAAGIVVDAGTTIH